MQFAVIIRMFSRIFIRSCECSAKINGLPRAGLRVIRYVLFCFCCGNCLDTKRNGLCRRVMQSFLGKMIGHELPPPTGCSPRPVGRQQLSCGAGGRSRPLLVATLVLLKSTNIAPLLGSPAARRVQRPCVPLSRTALHGVSGLQSSLHHSTNCTATNIACDCAHTRASQCPSLSCCTIKQGAHQALILILFCPSLAHQSSRTS